MFLQNFMKQNQKLFRTTTMRLCKAHNHCHPGLGWGNGGAGQWLGGPMTGRDGAGQ